MLLPKKNNIEFFKNAKNAKKEETKKKPVSDNTVKNIFIADKINKTLPF